MADHDRMPPIPEAQQTPDQLAVTAELVSGPRGRLVGPFVPLMRSPELMRRVQKLGEFLRFESRLPEDVKELAILVVARLWSQGFEWSFHLPLALKAGVSREAAEAIAAGGRPQDLTPVQRAAYAFLTELNAEKAVGDETWRRAELALGEGGVIELIGVNGYYALLAMVMNAARTPAPDAEIPLK
jgi:4-carboxymuconolactone decarboxylase